MAASSLAYFRCIGRVIDGNAVLGGFVREVLCARLVIERDLSDIEVDGEDAESTRSAARRRENLGKAISNHCWCLINRTYIMKKTVEIDTNLSGKHLIGGMVQNLDGKIQMIFEKVLAFLLADLT